MAAAIDWLAANWPAIIVPVTVFMAAIIATLWLRRVAYRWLRKRFEKVRWPADKLLFHTIRVPSILWCIIISAGLALAVSGITPEWKNPAIRGLWSLFLIAVTLSLTNVVDSLILSYSPRLKLSDRAIAIIRNVARVVILVVALLILLDIWDVPTTPLLLLIAVAVLVAALAFRDVFPNFIAGMQLSASQQFKVDDYIKLETGEEGYVVATDWNSTRIRTLDESIVIIPNSQLLRHAVINYGRPLRKAKEAFHFYSRTHLTELTGLKAGNLREFADCLKKAPDSVVYYHTHHFLEQHHYLTPEPANDFALWVNDALGNDVLAERLASVDTFEFPNLSSLRERLVSLVEEYLAQNVDGREAMEGREFHFMKAVSAIFPTSYVAHDLREFVEALRKISVGALYFHMFESRLRLGRGLNDFTIWLRDSLDEAELGEEIARLDPYAYTLEGLRLSLIQLIEKRIQ